MSRRTWLAPEVVQSSALDCGPASLKAMLEGFGVSVSYGRLREACQTDVDGTSIDVMEDVAKRLGIDAEQILLPADHFFLPESNALPAIVVVRLPNGLTHFVLVWRKHGRLIQVMDPAVGRRWTTEDRLLAEIYEHVMPVPAESWRTWASSAEAVAAFRRRLQNLGVSAKPFLERATRRSDWLPMAALDAATRAVESMIRAGAIGRGREAKDILTSLFDRACQHEDVIPRSFWSVRPQEDDGETVLARGAVLVRARGRRKRPMRVAEVERFSPELAAALREPPAKPGRELFRLLRSDGLLAPAFLAVTLIVAALGVAAEALFFRALLEIAPLLEISGHRLGIIAAIILFSILILGLEIPTALGEMRMGRRLETRLRVAIQEKIPKLGDRYFRSRLISDMAERVHSLSAMRHLPNLGGSLVRTTFELILTAGAIVWLDPPSTWLALAAAGIGVALPFLAQPVVVERDLRVRSHLGALSRFYLDALLGLVPVRVHGAARSLRREHEGLVVEWARARLRLQRAALAVEGLQATVGFGLAAWLLMSHMARSPETSVILLLAYWALNLPALGLSVAELTQQYPMYRNVTLRLMEPLGAPEEAWHALSDGSVSPPAFASPAETSVGFGGASHRAAVALELKNVGVRAGGTTILEGVSLSVPSGSHVAIVGASGAGKSTLVGLLLGWHRPSTGEILVDGGKLTGERLTRLRAETAWVDPSVQLWNRSFLDNLRYGAPPDPRLPVAQVIELAELKGVLEALPEGHQTSLGEGGGLVSGGEGQRVRLARAMLRPGVKLVILDEPFRGLDRTHRAELLRRARRLWQDVTLVCITHDVGETAAFDRAVVIDRGKLVEDGPPAELSSVASSRYRQLLDAEADIRALWSGSSWRRFQLQEGALVETESKVRA